MRSVEDLDAEGLGAETRKKVNLPLKRIIDTVHFAEKTDARPPQLADLCAFMLARYLKGFSVPPYAMEILTRHMKWAFKLYEDDQASSSAERSPS